MDSHLGGWSPIKIRCENLTTMKCQLIKAVRIRTPMLLMLMCSRAPLPRMPHRSQTAPSKMLGHLHIAKTQRPLQSCQRSSKRHPAPLPPVPWCPDPGLQSCWRASHGARGEDLALFLTRGVARSRTRNQNLATRERTQNKELKGRTRHAAIYGWTSITIRGGQC